MQLSAASGTLRGPVTLGFKVDSSNTGRQRKHFLSAPACPLRWSRQLESPVVGVIENEDWTPNNLDSGMLKVNEQMRYQ